MIQTVTELMTSKVVSLIGDRYYIVVGYCHVVCHMQYCMQHFRKGPDPSKFQMSHFTHTCRFEYELMNYFQLIIVRNFSRGAVAS